MNNRNQQVSGEYFDQLSDDYVKLIVDSQKHIYRNVNPVLTRRVSGRVLCLGSGSIMNFAATHADHVVCLDLSYNMLARLPELPKVNAVCSDAQYLPFDIATFDFVVIPFLIHHLAQDSVEDTDRAVSFMMAEARRVLTRNGRIIVVDMFLPAFFETFERSLYGPAAAMLNRSGRPMMYFYSVSNFTELIYSARLKVDFDQVVNIQEKIMPTLLMPWFKLPARMHPARFHILEVTKII